MDNEPTPPGSICPICASPDVDISNGKCKCLNKECGAEFQFRVTIETSKWSPYGEMNRWQKIRWFFTRNVRVLLDAFERLWCVHEYRMHTIDSWEEEISYNANSDSTLSLRTIVRDMPPYFVCKHCDKTVRAKVLKTKRR